MTCLWRIIVYDEKEKLTVLFIYLVTKFGTRAGPANRIPRSSSIRFDPTLPLGRAGAEGLSRARLYPPSLPVVVHPLLFSPPTAFSRRRRAPPSGVATAVVAGRRLRPPPVWGVPPALCLGLVLPLLSSVSSYSYSFYLWLIWSRSSVFWFLCLMEPTVPCLSSMPCFSLRRRRRFVGDRCRHHGIGAWSSRPFVEIYSP